MMTIINLAQNYVGSNNLNLLEPIGQFGTRLQGGKFADFKKFKYFNFTHNDSSRLSSQQARMRPALDTYTRSSVLSRVSCFASMTTPCCGTTSTTASALSQRITCQLFPWCSSTARRASAQDGARKCLTTTWKKSLPTSDECFNTKNRCPWCEMFIHMFLTS